MDSPSPFFPSAPVMGSPFGAPMAQSPFVFPTPQPFPSTFPMTTQEDTHNYPISHGDHHENSKVSTMNLKDRKQRLIERQTVSPLLVHWERKDLESP